MGEWGSFASRPVLRLLASLLCEDAAISIGLSDDRVSLQRTFFTLHANRFPASYDRMVVVNFWFCDGEGAYRETTRILAPDGSVAAQSETDLEIAGVRAHLSYFPLLVLPEPGSYTVEVQLDGVAVHSYTLWVRQLPEPPAQTGEEERDEQS